MKVNYLFPNFLRDESDFEGARTFWRTLCHEILVENQRVEDWEAWGESGHRPDPKFEDNFPIYSMIKRDRTKGIVINQQDPVIHTKWETAAWLDDFNEFYNPDSPDLLPLDYLVFNCNLTEENAQIFKKLFEAWIQPECNKQSMDELISDMIPSER